MTPGRVPPQNLDAEAAVLGACLLQPKVATALGDVLSPEDFYRQANGMIFETALALESRGQPVDILTVTEALRAKGQLESVGGASYVSELADRVATAANVRYYAGIVREKALRRRLITVATAITEEAYESREDGSAIVDSAAQQIFEVAKAAERRSEEVRMGDLLPDWYLELERRRERGVSGLQTGFVDLDRLIGGLQATELIVIGGRPGMGKSALAGAIAENVALSGTGVLFFSLEMSKTQLLERTISGRGRVNLQRIRTGTYSNADLERISEAAGEIGAAPLILNDSGSITPLEILAKGRRLKLQRDLNLGLIIVDYLQLMRLKNRGSSRQEDVAEISRMLKLVAKELELPIVALSQLNRQCEDRSPPEPRISDIRESGAIEQDADVIMFLYRPEMYPSPGEAFGTRPGEAEVIVAKQRNGPLDRVTLAYVKEFARFENFSRATP